MRPVRRGHAGPTSGGRLVWLLLFVALCALPAEAVESRGDLVQPDRLELGGAIVLDPVDEVFVIISPMEGYSASEASAIRTFLTEGGRMLLVDLSGSGRELLGRLDVGVQAGGARLQSYDASSGVTALAVGAWADMGVLHLNESTFALTGGGDPLFVSSDLTWTDADADGRPSVGETRGPHRLVVDQAVGRGRLIVASSAAFTTGPPSELVRRAVAELTDQGQRTLVLDLGHTVDRDVYAVASYFASDHSLALHVTVVGLTLFVPAGALGLQVRQRVRTKRTVVPIKPGTRWERAALAELEDR